MVKDQYRYFYGREGVLDYLGIVFIRRNVIKVAKHLLPLPLPLPLPIPTVQVYNVLVTRLVIADNDTG